MSANHTRRIGGILAALAMGLMTAPLSAAIVQQNDVVVGSQAGFTVSGSDLINQGESTRLSASTDATRNGNPYGAENVLTDGTLGGASTESEAVGHDSDTDYFVEYVLDTTTNTLGYNITQIQTIAAWAAANRVGQKFELLYSTVGNSTLISLGTFTLPEPTDEGDVGYTTRMTLTDNTGILASGVDLIRFEVQNLGLANYYREFDVVGTPVPEPASLGLLAMGSLTLLARRRRLARG